MTSDGGAHVSDVPALRVRDAALSFGSRTLWAHLDLEVQPGEFIVVLGANGSGKTSLLKVVLGLVEASAGRVEVLGHPARRGDRRIGYVPQQKLAEDGTPLRARDLVAAGIDGHRWGLPLHPRRRARAVDGLLERVGASAYANVPVSRLSGGEQQRLRVAQALAGEPGLLLCDEPLLSLDLRQQQAVSALIDRSRRELNLGVVFVTHDINPVLGMVDRVLYFAGGSYRIGTPDEVLRSEVLSELYGSRVDVVRTGGRVVVVGVPEEPHEHPHGEHDHGATR